MHAGRLRLAEAEEDGLIRLELHGELDMATAPAVLRSLLAAERSGADLIVVDVRDVTLLDAAGLRLFLDAARRAEHRERRFALARPNSDTARVLRLTGLDHSIDVLPELP